MVGGFAPSRSPEIRAAVAGYVQEPMRVARVRRRRGETGGDRLGDERGDRRERDDCGEREAPRDPDRERRERECRARAEDERGHERRPARPADGVERRDGGDAERRSGDPSRRGRAPCDEERRCAGAHE